jgi:hypothetical protein
MYRRECAMTIAAELRQRVHPGQLKKKKQERQQEISADTFH